MSESVGNVFSDAPIFLVEERPNSSTDYYFFSFLSSDNYQIKRCSFPELPPPSALRGAVLIFVRYVPVAWLKLVEKVRPELKQLIFFMDDDVLDVRASARMPLGYRYKIFRYAALRKNWLQEQRVELWVTTAYLQDKYSAWRPKLLQPKPLPRQQAIKRFFYHGSASHHEEIKWLRPVVEEVLRRDEATSFEIIGGQSVYKLYRDLPRVTVAHPLKWEAYQHFLAMPGRHVGLAPQLDTPFNKARSFTKFFDICRAGAVGIYSPNSACSDVVEDGVEGFIVELDPEAWAESILDLLRDDDLREKLKLGASNKEKKLNE